MCNECMRLKTQGQIMPFLARKGVPNEPKEIIGLEMTKDKLSSNKVTLTVCIKEPNIPEERRTEFGLKISYCPFCGEHF